MFTSLDWSAFFICLLLCHFHFYCLCSNQNLGCSEMINFGPTFSKKKKKNFALHPTHFVPIQPN